MSRTLPDRDGYFGAYGGRFVPETLMQPLAELEKAYARARRGRRFSIIDTGGIDIKPAAGMLLSCERTCRTPLR